jgi:aspartate kinase
MTMKIIMKFGGSVLDTPYKINNLVNIVKLFVSSDSKRNDIVCVVSAMTGVTDKILSLSEMIVKGNKEVVKPFVDDMRSFHIT